MPKKPQFNPWSVDDFMDEYQEEVPVTRQRGRAVMPRASAGSPLASLPQGPSPRRAAAPTLGRSERTTTTPGRTMERAPTRTEIERAPTRSRETRAPVVQTSIPSTQPKPRQVQPRQSRQEQPAATPTPTPAPTPTPTTQRVRRTRKTPEATAPTASTAPPQSAASYTSLYMNPKPAAAPNTTANKSTVIPALRAAGTRLVEKGEARSVDQGTALEIVSRILHRRVTIADIENDRKAASGISLFAAPTELVTLFELAMRMVESHQFYSKTL